MFSERCKVTRRWILAVMYVRSCDTGYEAVRAWREIEVINTKVSRIHVATVLSPAVGDAIVRNSKFSRTAGKNIFCVKETLQNHLSKTKI